MSDTMTRLLKIIGKPANCSGCNAEILWAKTKNDKWMPLNQDGSVHWESCPKSKDFKK
jgi:hypothetical protein